MSSARHRTARGRASDREPLAAKVPEITALFWGIKILTTGMGEATSDFLAQQSLVLAGAVGVTGFAIALWLQFRVRRYIAAVYWLAVAMVAVFGTMAADGLHKGLGVPYIGSSIFYALVLAAVFFGWHRGEGTLSIHSILTRRRELYYWAAVLATFALGTATGDLTAFVVRLGFLSSGLLFTGLILIPALAWWRFGLNEILAFWWAYVLTRPLGASFADWLGKSAALGGLGLGDGQVAAVAAVIIALLVGYVAITRGDIQPAAPAMPPRAVRVIGQSRASTD
ncbi:MAG: COG4705 family protein [Streptosporangiaceae bacterium]